MLFIIYQWVHNVSGRYAIWLVIFSGIFPLKLLMLSSISVAKWKNYGQPSRGKYNKCQIYGCHDRHKWPAFRQIYSVYDSCNGPITRYVKLRVVHAPGMPGSFSPPPTSKKAANKRSRHTSRHVCHARTVVHVAIAKPQWRGKRSPHSRPMRKYKFYVSGKRPLERRNHEVQLYPVPWRLMSPAMIWLLGSSICKRVKLSVICNKWITFVI